MIINWLIGLGLIIFFLGFIWIIVKLANSQAPTGKKKSEVKEMLKKIHTH